MATLVIGARDIEVETTTENAQIVLKSKGLDIAIILVNSSWVENNNFIEATMDALDKAQHWNDEENDIPEEMI